MPSFWEVCEHLRKNGATRLCYLYEKFGSGAYPIVNRGVKNGAFKKFTYVEVDGALGPQIKRVPLKPAERTTLLGATTIELSDNTIKYLNRTGHNSFLDTDAAKRSKEKIKREWIT